MEVKNKQNLKNDNLLKENQCFLGPRTSPNEPQPGIKSKDLRQDSNEDLNNGQMAAKLRPKTVREANFEAQKAHDHHWGCNEGSNFWGPGPP